MRQTEIISIPTSAGSLAGVVHLPDHLPAPVVICCHGLHSSKESAKFIAIGNELCRGGLAAVRFDFSGCGESKASPGINVVAGRMRDLDAVLSYVREQVWMNGLMGLLGSSLGGYLALLGAASGEHGVKAVVTLAAPFNLERVHLSAEESENLESLFPPGWERDVPGSLNGLPPITGVFIMHGKQDETVSWKDAVEIYRRVGEPKRLLLMEAAEHRFLDPSCRELAIRLSLEWFRERGFSGNR